MKSIVNLLFLILIPFVAHAQQKSFDAIEDVNYNAPWFKPNYTEQENFKRLIRALEAAPTGKKIINRATEKAAQKGLSLFEVIAAGEGSLTDTTLVRRFSAGNPNDVSYETRSKVYLSRRLKTLEALLDFAHELTHFTYREAFNPYDHRFALKDFIKQTVEGTGGEVDAYLVECKVLFELFPSSANGRTNCIKVLDKRTGNVSKELGIQEFYKVGSYYGEFKKEIEKFSISQKEMPKASDADALFISSAWGLPYPVAAIKEYVGIMDRVCKNDQNRLALMQSKLSRSPASEYTSRESTNAYKNMFEDFKLRCEKFTQI